jgi:hypothetical protein
MRIVSVSQSLPCLIAGATAFLMPGAGPARAAARAQTDLVEFDKRTPVRVKSAHAAGKTTTLIHTSGVEERGPQDANGGHDLIAHATVETIASKPGNPICVPELPCTRSDAEPIPGATGITNELHAAVLERLTEQALLDGFQNVILVGYPVVDGKVQIGRQSPDSGILGDARRSAAELVMLAFDVRVDYAVRPIRSLLTDIMFQLRAHHVQLS